MNEVKEITTKRHARRGVREFWIGGSHGSRCRITVAWEDLDADDQWQPMTQGRTNRLLQDELLHLQAKLVGDPFNTRLRE